MTEQHSDSNHSFWPNLAWDLWCIISVVGIWPRFIEPNLLFTSRVPIPIPTLPQSLNGFRIAFFSDLHLCSHMSESFLQRVSSRIKREKPHLIVFGGDALSYNTIDNPSLLRSFFSSLQAPFGTWASLGNHDYATYTTESGTGKPLLCPDRPSSILWGLKKLFQKTPSESLPRKAPVGMNEALLDLYKQCGVHVLHNTTTQIGKGADALNIAGLGDLTAGHLDPAATFKQWNYRLPGIVIGHNPNALPLVQSYPGDLLLFGHTHGGQVNLPFFWKRLAYVVDPKLKSGLIKINPLKTAYITRGVGSCYPFRWFSPPELVIFTLQKTSHVLIEEKAKAETKKALKNMQWATSSSTQYHG